MNLAAQTVVAEATEALIKSMGRRRAEETEKAVRITVTIDPETHRELQELKTVMDVNVSQLVDRGLARELARLRLPGDIADAVARFQTDSDYRRGPRHQLGLAEGVRWAKKVACWKEVCQYSLLTEDEVKIGWDERGDFQVPVLEFTGPFQAPRDYVHEDPEGGNEAPEFEVDGAWISKLEDCEQYWRGWLAGVHLVFDRAKEAVAPMDVKRPDPSPAYRAAMEREARLVDPDDIHF